MDYFLSLEPIGKVTMVFLVLVAICYAMKLWYYFHHNNRFIHISYLFLSSLVFICMFTTVIMISANRNLKLACYYLPLIIFSVIEIGDAFKEMRNFLRKLRKKIHHNLELYWENLDSECY